MGGRLEREGYEQLQPEAGRKANLWYCGIFRRTFDPDSPRELPAGWEMKIFGTVYPGAAGSDQFDPFVVKKIREGYPGQSQLFTGQIVFVRRGSAADRFTSGARSRRQTTCTRWLSVGHPAATRQNQPRASACLANNRCPLSAWPPASR